MFLPAHPSIMGTTIHVPGQNLPRQETCNRQPKKISSSCQQQRIFKDIYKYKNNIKIIFTESVQVPFTKREKSKTVKTVKTVSFSYQPLFQPVPRYLFLLAEPLSFLKQQQISKL